MQKRKKIIQGNWSLSYLQITERIQPKFYNNSGVHTKVIDKEENILKEEYSDDNNSRSKQSEWYACSNDQSHQKIF